MSDIVESLLEEYDVTRDCCERDVLTLLQELARENLISVRNETTS